MEHTANKKTKNIFETIRKLKNFSADNLMNKKPKLKVIKIIR